MLTNTIRIIERRVDRIHIYKDEYSNEQWIQFLSELILDLSSLDDQLETEYAHQDDIQQLKDDVAELRHERDLAETKLKAISDLL